MNSENELRREIIELTALLNEKKKILFGRRFNLMIDKTDEELIELGVKDVIFTHDPETFEWNINYTITVLYDENSYNYNSDSEVDDEPEKKTFVISFGKSKKYYIKGNKNNRFKIYKNSKKELRVINEDYDIELDVDEEQDDLIKSYSLNYNIPEWVAIKVFLFMSENDWNDKHIINYMSCV